MNEIWKPVKGYEGLYEVSNHGEIRGVKRGKKVKAFFCRQGYLKTKLHKNGVGKCVKVHRIVAISFLENPKNKPQVNHKDGIKDNNYISNLEWVTPSENIKHAYANGIMSSVGEKHNGAKLTEKDVLLIREMYKNGQGSMNKIAGLFGVSKGAISGIIYRKQWKHI